MPTKLDVMPNLPKVVLRMESNRAILMRPALLRMVDGVNTFRDRGGSPLLQALGQIDFVGFDPSLAFHLLRLRKSLAPPLARGGRFRVQVDCFELSTAARSTHTPQIGKSREGLAYFPKTKSLNPGKNTLFNVLQEMNHKN